MCAYLFLYQRRPVVMVSVGFILPVNLHASIKPVLPLAHTTQTGKLPRSTRAFTRCTLKHDESTTVIKATVTKRPRVESPSVSRRKPSALLTVQRAKRSLAHVQSQLFYLPPRALRGDSEEVHSQARQLVRTLLAIHTSVRHEPFVSLPDVSQLATFLQTGHCPASHDHAPPSVKQLLHPAGALSRACISTRRALQTAESALMLGFHPVNGGPPGVLTEPPTGWQDSLALIQAQIIHLTRSRTVGKFWLRNPWWHAIPYRFMRVHDDIIPAPPLTNVTISTLSDLRMLRQDSRAFLSTSRSVTLSVHTLIGLLGLTGQSFEQAGKECGPSSSQPLRAAVLSVWTEIMRKRRIRSETLACTNSESNAAWTFHDLFRTYHVPNALLVYLSEQSRSWHALTATRKVAHSGVRLRETGLFVADIGGVDFCAAPAALLSHRVRENFWTWGAENCAVVVNIEPSFVPLHEQRPNFENAKSQLWFKHSVPLARRQLDAISWIQAQAVMHACGPSVNMAHLVWYSVCGGTCIYEVLRNEEFIQGLSRYVETFFEKFVWTAVPPSASFRADLDGESLVTTASLQCKLARRLAMIPGDVSELMLSSFRRSMNQWECNRAKAVFNEGAWKG